MIIDVDLSSGCNAKCQFCTIWKEPKALISHDKKWNVILNDYALVIGEKILRISSTGEPLLHSETLDFIKLAKRKGITCEITTNASLLTESTSKILKECGCVVCISTEDIESEYEASRSLKWSVFLKNLKNASKILGNLLRINLTITSNNLKNIDKIIKYYKQYSNMIIIEPVRSDFISGNFTCEDLRLNVNSIQHIMNSNELGSDCKKYLVDYINNVRINCNLDSSLFIDKHGHINRCFGYSKMGSISKDLISTTVASQKWLDATIVVGNCNIMDCTYGSCQRGKKFYVSNDENTQ